ncbi:unnamed protein product [Ceutorhynchus assimilis]|uniref:DUF8207 domain-containing protein n=1 Tax=Ceutorhynchus assimilis TaxID=467358 RepID=A0A9N9QIW0_9CUCU|nr:unnamed protein product [Ceutorhynchus assimilis]
MHRDETMHKGKLNYEFQGPFEVMGITSEGRYELRRVGKTTITKAAKEQLREWPKDWSLTMDLPELLDVLENDPRELDLKRKLVAVTDAVRKKFKQIKTETAKDKFELERFYEPITKPLTSISNDVKQQKRNMQPNVQTKPRKQSVNTSIDTSEIFEESPSIAENASYQSLQSSTPIGVSRKEQLFETPPSSVESAILSDHSSGKTSIKSMRYLETLLSGLSTTPSQYDTVYGVHYGNSSKTKKKTYIGNKEVRFMDGKVSLYDDLSRNIAIFDGSSELYDLLFLKSPQVLDRVDEMSPSVRQNYRNILDLTNAVYHGYDKKRGLTETRWEKYSKIIKPLMRKTKLGEV